MVSRPHPAPRPGAAQHSRAPATDVAGYSRLGATTSRQQWIARLVALGTGIGIVYVYWRYQAGGVDVSPDSVAGLAFAVAGTVLLLLVALGYVFRKRINKRSALRLHTALAWHAVGGVLGLGLIVMHAAGNYNPRSGTYALYGLLALTVSGVVGRLIDRFAPRLAAAAAARTLTADGEDRLFALEQKISAAQSAHKMRRDMLRQSGVAGVPWDLAYYDLDPEVESIPDLLRPPRPPRTSSGAPPTYERLRRYVGTHTARLVGQPHSLAGYVRRQTAVIHSAQGRERYYIQMIRAWRRLHVLLSLVTLGLLIWHIVFAITLYINTMTP
jgi:hypothetical protein